MKRPLLAVVWGAGGGVAAASYFWGSSPRAGLIIGDKIIFTLVLPLALLVLCAAITMAMSGRGDPPPPVR